MRKTALGVAAALLIWTAAASAGPPNDDDRPKAPDLPSVELLYGIPAEGDFSAEDLGLEEVVVGNDGDATATDIYRFAAEPGQVVRIRANASVPIYLALLGPAGQLLAGDGTAGDLRDTAIVWRIESSEPYFVALNSFYGDPGTYSVDLSGATDAELPPPPVRAEGAEAGEPPGREQATPIALRDVVQGSFADGDFGLEDVIPENGGDRTFADAYRFDVAPGQIVSIAVDTDVNTYLALLNPEGRIVGGDGLQGDRTSTRIVRLLAEAGTHVIVVNSYYGQPGDYVLRAQFASEADIRTLSDELPVDGVLRDGEPVDGAIDLASRIFRTFVVDVPEGTQELIIETSGADNVDLFVRYGVQILQSYNLEPDHRSDGPSGDERVRINAFSAPPLRPGRYYVDVAALVPQAERRGEGERRFTVSARLDREAVQLHRQTAPAEDEERVTGPVGVELRTGERHAAVIDPAESTVQIWPVVIPPGATSLEIRTYGANGRLDLVATPPGMNLPSSTWDFFTVPHRAITARDNERLIIDQRSQPPLRPGLYTVAAFDITSTEPTLYEIEASIGDPLEAWEGFPELDRDDFAELSVAAQRRQAVVQLALSPSEEGGSTGSGVLLTQSGLILTNYHVIGECRPGSQRLYGCVGEVYAYPDGRPVDVYVGLTVEGATTPVQYFVARVVRADAEHDLALLRIDTDLNGDPVQSWLPTAPLSLDREALREGDSVSVVAYPGVAGLGGHVPIAETQTRVEGFTVDAGERVLTHLDAAVTRGADGGAVFREDGILVAVASNTHVRYDRGVRQGFARTLNQLPQEWVELLTQHGADIR
jgi:hypothetical protein